MGFYDKYKKCKSISSKCRPHHYDALIFAILEQLEVNDGRVPKENKPKTKDGEYVKSWFYGNTVTPVVEGLKFYGDEEFDSLIMQDKVDRHEFLRDMEKAVYDRELDEEIESFGKRRDERDKKVVDGVKKK